MTTRTRPAPPKRWIVMSVPGCRDDGSDTAWFVFDRLAGCDATKRADAMETLDEARAEARWRNGR